MQLKCYANNAMKLDNGERYNQSNVLSACNIKSVFEVVKIVQRKI